MPIPVITAAEMRAWETSTWASGVQPPEVVEQVGQVLAAELMRRTRSGEHILFVAGPGNNGADARACARGLRDRKVVLIDATDPVSATGHLQDELSEQPGWIVDGVFGTGLNRPLDPDWAGLVGTINRFRGFRVSIDIPTGLDATTGEVLGTAVQADETWTLGAPKTGLIVPSAAAFTGRVRLLADIGLRGRPKAAGNLLWSTAEDFVGFPSRRSIDGHKGTFGHAALLVGSHGYHGAAVLAARGALRARPGLTTLIVQPEILAVVAAQLSAPMVRPWVANLRLPDNTTSVVIGPGLAAKELPVPFRDLALRAWREHEGPVLADASALQWLPPRSGIASTLRVVTPHPGEAADMLDTTVDRILADRVGSVREISRRLGNAWVVLKGFQTLIGRTEGPVWVNSTGNPGLGQGGTGDVLAGFLGGLLAQPRLAAVPERTLAYAVWEHGAAADRLEEVARNWSSEELTLELGR